MAEDWDLGAVVRSCCNPVYAKSTINAQNYSPECPKVDILPLNHEDDDTSFRKIFGLSDKNTSPEDLYEVVRPFLVQTTNSKSTNNTDNFTAEDAKVDTFPPQHEDDVSFRGFLASSQIENSFPDVSFQEFLGTSQIENFPQFLDSSDISLKEFVGMSQIENCYREVSFRDFLDTSQVENSYADGRYEVVSVTVLQPSNSDQPSPTTSFVHKIDTKDDENHRTKSFEFKPKPDQEVEQEEDICIINEIPVKKVSPPRYLKRKHQKMVTIEISAEELNEKDPWTWHKYGQKILKSSPNPRRYYRCYTKDCPARRQIQQSLNDPKMLTICYRDDHNHEEPSANCKALGEKSIVPPTSPVAREIAASDNTNNIVANSELEEDIFSNIKEDEDDWYEGYF